MNRADTRPRIHIWRDAGDGLPGWSRHPAALPNKANSVESALELALLEIGDVEAVIIYAPKRLA